MAIQAEFLKSLPYFYGLSQAELESLRQLIFERAVDRGEVIAFEGEPAQALFFVVSGVVKIFKTSAEGKEQILGIVRPGGAFNDIPVFDDGLNVASTQAMGPVALYGIKKADFRSILQKYPQVSLNVARVLAEQVRQIVSLVEDLSFRHVISRVAKILLEHAVNGNAPPSRLTHQDIAAMAGTAREVVGRSLKVLEDEGIIRLERHRIIIVDKKALELLVQKS